VDPTPKFLEPVEQDMLRDVLRDHQRVGIVRGEQVEPDRHELAIAVADAELPSLDTEPHESLGDANRLEQLERSSVHDRSARGVRPFRLPIDHGNVMTVPGERRGDRQPCRPGTYHQHFGTIGNLTHHHFLSSMEMTDGAHQM
jgi:hypothetical protein